MSRIIDSRAVLARAWNTSHELPEMDRLALFDAERSELVMVNSLGREVWVRLNGVMRIDEITEAIIADADEAPPFVLAQEQVIVFLQDLLMRGAVELVET